MDAPGTFKSNIVPANRPRMPWQQALLRLDQPTAPREPLRRARKARERHKMVVFLDASGWKGKEIAQAMGYSQQQVSIILQSKHPELLAIRAEAQARVLDNSTDLLLRFRQEAGKSLDKLIEVRDTADDKAQVRLAARDILDRAGYSVVRKQINLNADVPLAQLEGVLDRVKEAHEVEQAHPEWDVTTPTRKEA